jgi:hypothetical protein
MATATVIATTPTILATTTIATGIATKSNFGAASTDSSASLAIFAAIRRASSHAKLAQAKAAKTALATTRASHTQTRARIRLVVAVLEISSFVGVGDR